MLANIVTKQTVMMAFLVAILTGVFVVSPINVAKAAKMSMPDNLQSEDVRILEKVPRMIRGEKQPAKAGYKFGMIRIEHKNNLMESVFRFDDTVMVYQGGRQINMDKIKLPCTAKIYYYPSKNNPYLYRIDVAEVPRSASSKWAIHPKDR